MIQCYQCEDWFHNHHLTPKLNENADDEFFLICKDCVEKHFKKTIGLYVDFMHPVSKDHFSCLNPEDVLCP
jgi:uncharacterized CHY-type Zn-finger protein